MSDLDNLGNKYSNRVKRELDWYKNKLSLRNAKEDMKKAADNQLAMMRSKVIGTVDSNIDDMLGELRTLSTGVLRQAADSIYSTIKDSVNKMVGTAVASAPEYFGTTGTTIINEVAQFVGFPISSSKTYLPKKPTSIKKILNAQYLQELQTADPVSLDVDMEKYFRGVLEDSGYISDRYRSTRFAKDLHFIMRPVMESDNGGHYRSFAYFTRPNLNLVETTSINGRISAVHDLVMYPNLLDLTATNLDLYSELCRDGAGKSNLFTYLNNYVKIVPPNRLSETNREGIKNMYGKSTPIPGIPEIYNEHEVSVTFLDNGRGDIAKLLYMLSYYKSFVGTQGYPMRPEYIKNRSIDYLMSLYVVTVDSNWEIIGFGVYIGLMIAEPPTHLTQHNIDGFSKNELVDEFTVTFKCDAYYPMAADYYDTFNVLSGFNPDNIVDTRGSGSILFHTARENSGGGDGSKRSSVFENNGGFDGVRSRVERVGSSYTLTKTTTANSSVIDKYDNSDSQLSRLYAQIIDNANKKFPDVFEYCGKSPGVYTAIDTLDPNTRRFMFGFSF